MMERSKRNRSLYLVFGLAELLGLPPSSSRSFLTERSWGCSCTGLPSGSCCTQGETPTLDTDIIGSKYDTF